MNPAKLAAVRLVAARVWPGSRVLSVEVASGVGEQPTSDDEAITGALRRAKSAIMVSGADLGIGLEGNTVDTEHGMFLSGWAAVVDRKGESGLGCGGRVLLPEYLASEIRAGRELGPLMDELTGKRNTREKGGAVGILTRDLVSRTEAFERAVLFALSKFLSPDLPPPTAP